MSGAEILSVWAGAIWDVTAHMFAAAPLMWSAFLAANLCLGFAVYEALEQRGWRATAWAIGMAAALGLTLAAIAPAEPWGQSQAASLEVRQASIP